MYIFQVWYHSWFITIPFLDLEFAEFSKNQKKSFGEPKIICNENSLHVSNVTAWLTADHCVNAIKGIDDIPWHKTEMQIAAEQSLHPFCNEMSKIFHFVIVDKKEMNGDVSISRGLSPKVYH